MRPFNGLSTAIIIVAGIWLANVQSIAADCAHGDALACYTEALVKLQAAEDALGAARNDIARLQTQIGTLQGSSATMRQEIEALKAAIAANNQSIVATNGQLNVIDTQTKPVRPGGTACVLVQNVMEVPFGWQAKGEFGNRSPEISGHECLLSQAAVAGSSYRADAAGAQPTAQSERIKA